MENRRRVICCAADLAQVGDSLELLLRPSWWRLIPDREQSSRRSPELSRSLTSPPRAVGSGSARGVLPCPMLSLAYTSTLSTGVAWHGDEE